MWVGCEKRRLASLVHLTCYEYCVYLCGFAGFNAPHFFVFGAVLVQFFLRNESFTR